MPNLVFLYYDPDAPRVRITDLEGDFSWGFTLLAKIATARNKVMINGWAQSNNGIDKVEVKLDWGEYQLAAGGGHWQYLLDVTDVPSFPHYHFITVKATDGEGKIVRTYLHLIVLPATERSVVYRANSWTITPHTGEKNLLPNVEIQLNQDGMPLDIYINSIKYDHLITDDLGTINALVFANTNANKIIGHAFKSVFISDPNRIESENPAKSGTLVAELQQDFLLYLDIPNVNSKYIIASEGGIIQTDEGIILTIPPDCLKEDLGITIKTLPIKEGIINGTSIMLTSNWVIIEPSDVELTNECATLQIPTKDNPIFPNSNFPEKNSFIMGFAESSYEDTINIPGYNNYLTIPFNQSLKENGISVQLNHFSSYFAIVFEERLKKLIDNCIKEETYLFKMAFEVLDCLRAILCLGICSSNCSFPSDHNGSCNTLKVEIQPLIDFLNCLNTKVNIASLINMNILGIPDISGFEKMIIDMIADDLNIIIELIDLLKANNVPAPFTIEDLENLRSATEEELFDFISLHMEDLTNLILHSGECVDNVLDFKINEVYLTDVYNVPLKEYSAMPSKFKIKGTVSAPSNKLFNIRVSVVRLKNIDDLNNLFPYEIDLTLSDEAIDNQIKNLVQMIGLYLDDSTVVQLRDTLKVYGGVLPENVNGNREITPFWLAIILNIVYGTSFTGSDITNLITFPSVFANTQEISHTTTSNMELGNEKMGFDLTVYRDSIIRQGDTIPFETRIAIVAFWELPNLPASVPSMLSLNFSNAPMRTILIDEPQTSNDLNFYNFLGQSLDDIRNNSRMIEIEWVGFQVFVDGDVDWFGDPNDGDWGFFARYNYDMLNDNINFPYSRPDEATQYRMRIDEEHEIYVEDDGHPIRSFYTFISHMINLDANRNFFTLTNNIPLILGMRVKEYDSWPNDDDTQLVEVEHNLQTFIDWGQPLYLYFNNNDFDISVEYRLYCKQRWYNGINWGECDSTILER